MSEDEAFIRAIVDSPGDDLPRLVYADWLDDRADPRGPYLRAEREWAKPWRTGTPPGWSVRKSGRAVPEWELDVWPGLAAFARRASGLDPVWVARVSRPPAGVCCDHLKFRGGPRLQPEDITTAEDKHKRRFPNTLAAFLLNYNGGEPDRRKLVVRCSNEAEGWHWDDVVVGRFVQLSPRGESGSHASTLAAELDELTYFEEELGGFGVPDVTSRYVPIGRHSTFCTLLMKWEGDPSEAVYVLDTEAGELAVPEPLVPSLPQLLARIITDPI